jgi:predicted Zn-dependent protease
MTMSLLPMRCMHASRVRRASLAALCGLVTVTALTSAKPAAAQNLPLIRDTEIENLLNDYASPIFRAAGLGS